MDSTTDYQREVECICEKQLCLLIITEFTSTLIRIGCGIALINGVLLAVLIEKRFDYLVILRYFPGYMCVNLYYIFFIIHSHHFVLRRLRLIHFPLEFRIGHTELQFSKICTHHFQFDRQ